MYIRSKLSSELPHKKEIPGSYEWWYFDAMSADKKWAIVIIFYEGNPFSPAYIKAQEEARSSATHYPETPLKQRKLRAHSLQ